MLTRLYSLRSLPAALILFVFSVPAVAQGRTESYSGFLERAEELHERGQYVRAIGAYSRALDIEETYEAYLGRGWARYYLDGAERESIGDFDRALELKPGDPYATGGRGFAHSILGNAEEAVRDISVYLEVAPTDAAAYVVRAYSLSQLGRESAAEADRELAASLDPRYADDELDWDGLLVLAILFGGWLVLMSFIGLFMTRGGRRALLVSSRRGTPAIYDGGGKELFRIYLQNVVLTLLTLGVYRFWAKVRNRQFHYQHTSFAKGRFDYHATGMEKFLGFLKGMAILAPAVVALWFLGDWATQKYGEEFAPAIVTYGFLLFMFALRPLILVGSQRFNLARTSWNNLRLHFSGKVPDAYKLYGRDLPLLIFTLGLYWPWHACRVRAFKMRHTRIGNARFSFHGEGGSLFGIQFFGTILCYVTLGIYVPWFVAQRYRFFTRNTRFEGKRLESNLTGGSVLAIGGPAILATILTLGLALPWAVTRWRTLLTHTTYYTAEIDAEQMQSIRDSAASSTLEGLGEAGELMGEIGDIFGV